jgi:hypothetical protein
MSRLFIAEREREKTAGAEANHLRAQRISLFLLTVEL